MIIKLMSHEIKLIDCEFIPGYYFYVLYTQDGEIARKERTAQDISTIIRQCERIITSNV